MIAKHLDLCITKGFSGVVLFSWVIYTSLLGVYSLVPGVFGVFSFRS